MKRKPEHDSSEAAPKRQCKNVDPRLQSEWQDHNLDPELFGDDRSSFYSVADTSTTSNALPTDTAPTPLTPGSPNPQARRKFPSDIKTLTCPTCPKTFNRPARLAAHLRSHTNDRPFICTFDGCTKRYLEEKHLKQHIKGSHTQERQYACPEADCGKSFVTATRLRRHAAVHEGAERFRCGDCGRSFRKHQTLQRHVRTDHLGRPAYPCPRDGCASPGFDTAGALKRHVEREHGELRFWCDECGVEEGGRQSGDVGDDAAMSGGGRVGFTTLALLQAHMRREHVDCMFCDVRCGSQSQLERHIEMYHSGSTVEDRKTIACTWPGCPKTFTRRNNLNMHVKTAHEGYRFVCGEVDTFATEDIADWNWIEEGCGEGFISKMKLEEHVRFVHLGKKRPPKPHAVETGPGVPDDLVDPLVGIAEEAKRNITCSVEGCLARFIRYHDLSLHLKYGHGSDSAHIQEGKESHRGVYDLPEDGAGAIDPLDPEFSGQGRPYGEEQFWFAAEGDTDHGKAEFEREWADMRRLIDVDALVDGQT